jgi:hypothetical protein
MPYRVPDFDDNRGITSLAVRRLPGVKRRGRPAQGLKAMWSSHLIAFAAAVCALTMSASAASEARSIYENGVLWALSGTAVMAGDTIVEDGAHGTSRSSDLAGGHARNSMARDYGRVLEALSRAMQQTTRRRRRVPGWQAAIVRP